MSWMSNYAEAEGGPTNDDASPVQLSDGTWRHSKPWTCDSCGDDQPDDAIDYGDEVDTSCQGCAEGHAWAAWEDRQVRRAESGYADAGGPAYLGD